jgi:hypothetical protein
MFTDTFYYYAFKVDLKNVLLISSRSQAAAKKIAAPATGNCCGISGSGTLTFYDWYFSHSDDC